MWGKKLKQRFDVTAWSGQVDLTRAVVTISMLAGLSLLWISVAVFVRFQV